MEPREQGLVLPPPKEQGVIPLLGATLTELEKLGSVTKDHLEVGEPGDEAGVTRIEVWEGRAPYRAPRSQHMANLLS